MTSILRYFDARGRREINKKIQLVVGVAGGAARYETIEHVTAQRPLKAREKANQAPAVATINAEG